VSSYYYLVCRSCKEAMDDYFRVGASDEPGVSDSYGDGCARFMLRHLGKDHLLAVELDTILDNLDYSWFPGEPSG
jgi:hypothetical protein